MSNFNDYYNYMTNGYNNDFYNNQNNFDNNTFQNTFLNMYNNPKLYSPNEGFTKGNMYENLYYGYKNYKPMPIIANSEKESLLNQIQMYKFAMNDLALYLDINPKNSSLIKLYNDYLTKSKQLINNYEKLYGPLCNDALMNTSNWSWNNAPWPWESDK